jgi:hypothetical protein
MCCEYDKAVASTADNSRDLLEQHDIRCDLLSTLAEELVLHVLQMQANGWKWYDAALFGSMIASTDAVAIVAVLKTGAHVLPVTLAEHGC